MNLNLAMYYRDSNPSAYYILVFVDLQRLYIKTLHYWLDSSCYDYWILVFDVTSKIVGMSFSIKILRLFLFNGEQVLINS